MLGSVKDEAEGGRGEALPAHRARQEEAGLRYSTEVRHRRVDPGRETSKQTRQFGAILVGSALGSEGVELLWREGGPPRVGQETIQAARQMEEMEANRRHTARSRPELIGGEVGDEGKDVLAHLQDGMGGGLKDRSDTVDRSAQPDFGGCGHGSQRFRNRP